MRYNKNLRKKVQSVKRERETLFLLVNIDAEITATNHEFVSRFDKPEKGEG